MVAFRFENEVTFLSPASNDNCLGDLRFQRLLGRDKWRALPARVRERFRKRVGPGEATIYRGHVLETRQNWLGRLLAKALHLIDAPLPLDVNNVGAAAVVTVTEDPDGNGQIWTRQYGRPHGFPQVIHSAKRFDGPTGLTEHVGRGVGMSLTLDVEEGTLLFVSDQYFVTLFGRRVYLPRWLGLGKLRVGHKDVGHGAFLFTLNLHHRLFGNLLHQVVMFEDI